MSEQNQAVNEIDLVQLFKNMVANIKSFIFKSLLFFVRNILFVIVVVIVSVLLVFLQGKTTKYDYQGNLLLLSNAVGNAEAVYLINNWNYQNSFSEEELSKINYIKADFVDFDYDNSYELDILQKENWRLVENDAYRFNKNIEHVNTLMANSFYLSVEVTDTAMLSVIKERCLSFLNINTHIAQLNNFRVKQKKDFLLKIDSVIANTSKSKTIKKLNFDITESLVYDKEIYLYRLKQSKELELFLGEAPFVVMHDFGIPRIITHNEFVRYLLYYLMIGFLLILLWDKRKSINNSLKKLKQ